MCVTFFNLMHIMLYLMHVVYSYKKNSKRLNALVDNAPIPVNTNVPTNTNEPITA
jgi:hypothetical protein